MRIQSIKNNFRSLPSYGNNGSYAETGKVLKQDNPFSQSGINTQIRLSMAPTAQVQNIPVEKIAKAKPKYTALKVAGAVLALGAITFGIIKALKKPSKITEIKEAASAMPKYIQELAEGLSLETGRKIKPEQLSSVMTPDELMAVLPKLKAENYIASPENIAKGIFRADLHSHSNFSDGEAEVRVILEQVSNYSNKLFSKTKEKFIYALTDHDGVDSVKKALEIIAENPEKFQNTRFIPALEASYTYATKNSQNAWEIGEFLIYGINPFSKNVNDFCANICSKRATMLGDFLNEMKKMFPDVNFSHAEAQKLFNIEGTTATNMQWRMFHYAETKRAVTEIAKESGENPEKLYESIIGKLDREKRNLHEAKLIEPRLARFQEDWQFKKGVCMEKFSPRVQNGKIVDSRGENTFENIIETFSKEDRVVLSFAHPAYISNSIRTADYQPDYEGTKKFLSELNENSKGLVKISETYHQAYRPGQKGVDEINRFMASKNLLNIGGRDNHLKDWLPSELLA